MLKLILSNIVIYQHLCQKILKEASHLTAEPSREQRAGIKNIMADSGRAEKIKEELVYLTNNIKDDDKNKCANCENNTDDLKTLELRKNKKPMLCHECYNYVVKGYLGSIFA